MLIGIDFILLLLKPKDMSSVSPLNIHSSNVVISLLSNCNIPKELRSRNIHTGNDDILLLYKTKFFKLFNQLN